uniref:Uncharacterized protein n=1 Tax=Anopheles albimanus TaxID=7167 RepID=A0A182FNV5_ANOAL
MVQQDRALLDRWPTSDSDRFGAVVSVAGDIGTPHRMYRCQRQMDLTGQSVHCSVRIPSSIRYLYRDRARLETFCKSSFHRPFPSVAKTFVRER